MTSTKQPVAILTQVQFEASLSALAALKRIGAKTTMVNTILAHDPRVWIRVVTADLDTTPGPIHGPALARCTFQVERTDAHGADVSTTIAIYEPMTRAEYMAHADFLRAEYNAEAVYVSESFRCGNWLYVSRPSETDNMMHMPLVDCPVPTRALSAVERSRLDQGLALPEGDNHVIMLDANSVPRLLQNGLTYQDMDGCIYDLTERG